MSGHGRQGIDSTAFDSLLTVKFYNKISLDF
jgi:hypothetical protein